MTLALFFFAAWPSPEPFPMYVGPCQCLRRSSAPRFSLLYYYYYCFFFFFSPFLPSWLPPLSAVPVLFPRLATAAMALHRGDVPWMYCNGGTVPLVRGTRGTPTFLRFSFFFFPQRHNRVSGTVTRLFSTLSPARVANTRPRSCMYIGRGCLCGCGAAAPSCVWKGDVAVRSGSLLAKHPTFFPRPWSAVRVHSLRCCAYVYYFSLSFTAPLFSPLPGVFASYTPVAVGASHRVGVPTCADWASRDVCPGVKARRGGAGAGRCWVSPARASRMHRRRLLCPGSSFLASSGR